MIDENKRYIDMVEFMSNDKASTRALEIALRVMRHFEKQYEGKAFSSVDRNGASCLLHRASNKSGLASSRSFCAFSLLPII